MGRIEELAEHYGKHVALPWERGVAGAQRVIMVVYDKEAERMLRARRQLFATATEAAGHDWGPYALMQHRPNLDTFVSDRAKPTRQCSTGPDPESRSL